jgi:hypothetical protein
VAIPRRSYVALVVIAVLGTAATMMWPSEGRGQQHHDAAELQRVAERVDAACAEAWADAGVEPLGGADELRVARRLSLALTGAVPSLEEIRAIQAAPKAGAVAQHLDRLLADRRYADYFAQRLARAFVGDDEGPFLVFRRRRFEYWLSDVLAKNTPYDVVVRKMIAGTGLWTDHPETNFITGHQRDPVQLTARTTRAFLGMRLDCAQCHDHPFSHWKQSDFQGLAAHYAGIEQSVRGITDDGPADFKPGGRMMMMGDDAPVVEPSVPFAEGAYPAEGGRRWRLAQWVTSRDNPAFGKAIANRVWTMMLGTSVTKSGVDDIEGPERVPGLLELLGRDFAEHGHDLRRLIRVIARTRAFRMRAGKKGAGSTSEAEEVYAAFPIRKLRPEQLAGSLVQISRLHAVDAESHILWRLMKSGNVNDFVARYGDAGEEELREQKGTLMQQLVLMNGRIVRERIEANLFNAAGRIAGLSPDDETRVEVAFLTVFSRKPTDQERDHFLARLKGKSGKARQRAMEDMLWAMVNATEFSWNH